MANFLTFRGMESSLLSDRGNAEGAAIGLAKPFKCSSPMSSASTSSSNSLKVRLSVRICPRFACACPSAL